MKTSISRIAAIAALAALAIPAFANGKADASKQSGPVTIELWYGAAVTEAGPPPADWKALQIVRRITSYNVCYTKLLRTFE